MNNSDIPTVNWQEKSGNYKVVQVIIEGHPYLWYGAKGDYHSDILAEILVSFGIRYPTIVKGFLKIPAIQGKEYDVRGVGYSLVDVEGAFFFIN